MAPSRLVPLRVATTVFAVVLGSAATAACSATPDEDLPGPELLAEAEVEVVATITVDDRGFDRDETSVVAGEAVELVNAGDEPHGFRSGTAFDTGLLLPGERTVVRLTTPDDYEFVDMATGAEGTLVVEPDPDAVD